MARKSTQSPMTTEELHEYLSFFLSKEVKDEAHADRINKLARRTVTLSDVVVTISALTQHQTEAIAQLIDKLQVQERVIKKLEATEDMFLEAEAEYAAVLKEKTEAIKAQYEMASQAGKTATLQEAE